MGAPYYVQNLAAGALLIFVVVVQLLATRYRRRGVRMRLTASVG